MDSHFFDNFFFFFVWNKHFLSTFFFLPRIIGQFFYWEIKMIFLQEMIFFVLVTYFGLHELDLVRLKFYFSREEMKILEIAFLLSIFVMIIISIFFLSFYNRKSNYTNSGAEICAHLKIYEPNENRCFIRWKNMSFCKIYERFI